MSSPLVITRFNPLSKHDHVTENVKVGSSLIDFLQARYPSGFSRPTRVTLNGDVLPVDDYDHVFKEGDKVHIQVLPADPVSVGVIALVSGGIGAYLILSSMTPDVPSIPEPELPTNLKEQLPGAAYNLREQRNLARLGEPIPSQYGKIRVFPDLAASPWFEFSDNHQYLNQLFCLGWGEFDIHSLRLGDVALDLYDNLTYEVYEPNAEVNLFHDNMYTVPSLKDFDLYQANRYKRTSLSFDFSKTNSKVIGPVSTNFNEYIEAGDTILIECSSTTTFEGEFLVDSVTESEIVLDDVSDWPGDDNSPGTVTIYNKKYVQYLVPGFTDLDEPFSITDRTINTGATQGHVTNPAGTTCEIFYVDLDFHKGLYDNSSGEYQDQTASVTLVLFPLDNNGNYVYSTQAQTGSSTEDREGTGLSWYPTDSSEAEWDSTSTFTFYDNGVEVPSGDIASITYGEKGSGAHVTFTSAKTGPITYDGTTKDIERFGKQVSVSFASPLPQYRSIEFDMSTVGGWTGPGRYEAYIYRSNGYDWNNDNKQDDAKIVGLRAKLTAVSKYGPYTMLAVRMKSTANIDNSNSKKINTITTRKLPVWNGSTWSAPTATRSIAWALADIWMSSYGASRSYLDLDLDTLLTLDTLWTSRGDTFDGVFDSRITIWEALQKVARAGRCKPIFDGTTLTFVRDGAQSAYTAVFGPDNMVRNSFKMEYTFPDDQTPTSIRVKYLDEDNNYSQAEVLSSNKGGKIKEIDFFGCVNYNQAWRESQYLESQMVNQRMKITFQTELLGHIPFYGDLISVHHDLPSWGQGGQVEAKSGTTITTNQALDWTGSAPFYMSFMKPNGSLSGPHTVTQGTGDHEAILDTDVTEFTFITELSNQNRTLYQFGPSTAWNKACVVTKVTPQSDNERVSVECVPYVGAIHTADTGTPPTKPSTTPTGDPIPSIIGGLNLSNVPESGSVTVTWNPANDADNYKVQKSTNNSTWVDVSTPSIATETIAATGTLYVRVASVIGSTVGHYSQKSIVAS